MGRVFTEAEGRYIDVLDVLLRGRRGSAKLVAPDADWPPPDVADAGARRIAIAGLRYLLDSGGREERTVLRAGARLRGRLWDTPLNEGFSLTFTAATRDLWVGASRHLPKVLDEVARRGPSGHQREGKRMARAIVHVGDTRPGDWVFFALVHRALPALALPPAAEHALARRLARGSPLVALLTLDDDDGGTVARLTEMLASPDVRVLECTPRALLASWERGCREALGARGAVDDFVTRVEQMRAVLEGGLDALEGAGRLDLARPWLGLAARLATEVLPKGDNLREVVTRRLAFRRLDERDRAVDAVAGLVGLGPRLLRMRDHCAVVGYGEERYEEAQVFVADADAILAPHRRRTQDVAQQLSGAIG